MLYLGKNKRFFSKYAFKPLLILSRSALQSKSFSSNPGLLAVSTTLALSPISAMIPFHVASTFCYQIKINWKFRSTGEDREFHDEDYTLNKRPSSGICRIMSSEENTGSRYNHWACTLSHSSSVAEDRSSAASQALTLSKKQIKNT